MNISTLEYFKQIVEMQSISKVAQNSHISQSALSQIIQKLESELGYCLLNRSNRGVHPTEMGEVVYKYAMAMLGLYKKMEDELLLKKRALENVTINGDSTVIDFLLPCLLFKLKKKFPTYKFDIHSKSNTEICQDLQNGVADLGFVYGGVKSAKLVKNFIIKDRIVLVACSKNERIPNKIGTASLIDYDFVMLDEAFSVNYLVKDKLMGFGIRMDDLNIIFEVDSIASVKSTVENNLALSFLPYRSVKRELAHGELKIVEIEGCQLDVDIFMLSNKHSKHAKTFESVIRYFVESGADDFC